MGLGYARPPRIAVFRRGEKGWRSHPFSPLLTMLEYRAPSVAEVYVKLDRSPGKIEDTQILLI